MNINLGLNNDNKNISSTLTMVNGPLLGIPLNPNTVLWDGYLYHLFTDEELEPQKG